MKNNKFVNSQKNTLSQHPNRFDIIIIFGCSNYGHSVHSDSEIYPPTFSITIQSMTSKNEKAVWLLKGKSDHGATLATLQVSE